MMSAAAWPWPAPVDDGGARHLRPGASVPDVRLSSVNPGDDGLSLVRGAIALFVYTWTGRPGLANPPGWDDIPGAHGSTPEAEGFRDLHDEFRAAGWRVAGVSTQDSAHQREFAERLKLPYPLLSDAGGELQRALRLPTFETGGVTYLRRVTLLIRNGVIANVFYPVHPPDTHARSVLDWIQSQS